MGQWVLWAVACLFGAAYALNLTTIILVTAVFWPRSFTKSEYDLFGLAGSLIFLCCARFFGDYMAGTGLMTTLVKPSVRVVVLRMLAAASICLLTVAYCLALVYYWLLLPGLKAPWLLVFNVWILSLFPMLLLMNIALRGVYYVGDERRDEIIASIPSNEIDGFPESYTDILTDTDDKKPLICEA